MADNRKYYYARIDGGDGRFLAVEDAGRAGVLLHHLSFLFLCFLGRAWNGSGLRVHIEEVCTMERRSRRKFYK